MKRFLSAFCIVAAAVLFMAQITPPTISSIANIFTSLQTFNGGATFTGTNSFGGTNTFSTLGTFNAGASTSFLNQTAASATGGSCAMVAGTSCTITVGHTYTTPLCIATQQSGTLTGAAVGCTVSGTTVTVTAAVANSETWAALVFGNPN